MPTLREIYGATVSAAFTGAVFFAPLLATLTSAPQEIEVLAPPELPIVTLRLQDLEALTLASEADDEIAGDTSDPSPELDGPADEDADALVDATDDIQEVAAEEVLPAAPPPPPPPPPERKPEPVPVPEVVPEPAATKVPTPPKPRAIPASLPKTTTTQAKRVRRRKPECDVPHPQVTREAPGMFVIDRALVDYYSGSIKRINTLGYSRRYAEGNAQGWLIGGFGCKSPLWKAGLRSRDVIQSVNGKKTYNVVQIFGLWLSQRNKDAFEITVLRRGKQVKLNYEVR